MLHIVFSFRLQVFWVDGKYVVKFYSFTYAGEEDYHREYSTLEILGDLKVILFPCVIYLFNTYTIFLLVSSGGEWDAHAAEDDRTRISLRTRPPPCCRVPLPSTPFISLFLEWKINLSTKLIRIKNTVLSFRWRRYIRAFVPLVLFSSFFLFLPPIANCTCLSPFFVYEFPFFHSFAHFTILFIYQNALKPSNNFFSWF